MLATECVEAHDATEEDGHVVISFSRHRTLVSQLVGNRLRKDGVQQPVQWDWEKAVVRNAGTRCSAPIDHFIEH